MKNKLTKKYGLFTAVSMVVGIVIGSGVFFKAQDILNYTGGNTKQGIAAWLTGGAVMMICAYVFSCMAAKYEKVNGLVDYAETACSKRYAYMTGWFIATIYYPAMTSVLAWVSARFTCILFGISNPAGGTECLVLAWFYLAASFTINIIAPKIAGKIQVSTTVIKLIPLVLVAILGTIIGMTNNLPDGLTAVYTDQKGSVFAAVVAAAFAYEGWIIATCINSELKNSKRNLPIALMVGSAIVVFIYISYFIGITGSTPVNVLMEEGASAAFPRLFGNAGGVILNVFVTISCLGTLNGLMLACCRGLYSLAARGEGYKPQVLGEVSASGMPANSGIIGFMACAAWLLFWYGGIVRSGINNLPSLWGIMTFDSSELPIITIYSLYIPIFINIMRREKEFGIFKRFVMPALALLSCLFMVYCAIAAHKKEVLAYLVVFIIIMAAGIPGFKKSQIHDGL